MKLYKKILSKLIDFNNREDFIKIDKEIQNPLIKKNKIFYFNIFFSKFYILKL